MGLRKLGAVADLTVAVEFLMVAIRDVSLGHEIEGKRVQENIDWAMAKIGVLQKVPKGGHKVGL